MRDVKMLSRHLRFSARFVRADIVETPSSKNVLLFTKVLFVLNKILFVLQKICQQKAISSANNFFHLRKFS